MPEPITPAPATPAPAVAEHATPAPAVAAPAIPALGLPLYGLRSWSLGGRMLTFDITATGTIELAVDGRPLKRFPHGSARDAPAALAVARAEWRLLRPQAVAAIARARDQLTAAMDDGHTWPLPVFAVEIAGHPLMRRLATRLVWSGVGADGAVRCYGRLTQRGRWDLGPGRASVLPEEVVGMRLQRGEQLPEQVRASWAARFAAQPIDQALHAP